MSIKEILFFFSLSISLPFIAGIVALIRTARKSDIIPLLVCLGLGFMVEIIDYKTSNATVFNYTTNSYLLIETTMLLYQYSKWNKSIGRNLWWAIGVFSSLVWLLSTLLVGMENRNTVFIVYYSLLLVVIGINTVNYHLFKSSNVSKKYILIISLAYTSYLTFAIIVELILYNYSIFSIQFVSRTFYIKAILNCVTNIIIAYGLLCIPRKPKYLLSFS